MVSLQAAFVAMVLSGTGQTVLLDFYADWCGPCKAMEPTVRAIQEKGYPVQRVNIDQNPALATQYGVRSIPCFVMLVDGQKVDSVTGGTTFSRLERMCKMTSPQQPGNPPTSLLAQNSTPPNILPAQPNAVPLSGTAPGSFHRQDDPNIIPASFTSPAGARPAERGNSLDAKLIAASVRLRIEDPNGNSCGSGTIIDSRGNEALILTCGHIFRDSQGKGQIDVDLFGPYAGQRISGRLISYDLTRDVGLIAIRTPGPMAAARLAPPGYRVQKGDSVLSTGCDNGKDPTMRQSRVTSLNRYAGPSNLQVAGQPTEGRSGGGLFTADGMVIGVCNARDPQDQEGYYAALDTVCAQLDQSGLAFAYQAPQGYDGINASAPMLSVNNAPPMPQRMPQSVSPSSMPNISQENMGQAMAAAGTAATGLNLNEQAAMDEIRRRLKEGAEVVCVIRSRRDPQCKSEVIMLDKASPEFLQQLAGESQSQKLRQETSLETPRPRQPALEWSANGNSNSWRQGQ
jgi:thiol-disulfide isomerase/thioredoxin